jgi:hypothetical protein
MMGHSYPPAGKSLVLSGSLGQEPIYEGRKTKKRALAAGAGEPQAQRSAGTSYFASYDTYHSMVSWIYRRVDVLLGCCDLGRVRLDSALEAR